jgi:hypothetical protein
MEQCRHAGIKEVLVVNGSGPKRQSIDTVSLLRECAGNTASEANQKHWFETLGVQLGVAYNPYFPTAQERQVENKRLHDKLSTAVVSSVWLQFGSNTELLREGLQELKRCCIAAKHADSATETAPWCGVRVVGSVFVPSKQFLAQQKFRPWLPLSQDYLSSIETATAMTQQILQVYKEFNVEILIESTVKSEADMTKVMSFLQVIAEDQTDTTTTTTAATAAAAAAAAATRSTGKTDADCSDAPKASKKQKLTAK